jgi:hypothetical protein
VRAVRPWVRSPFVVQRVKEGSDDTSEESRRNIIFNP